jgi:NitT/TauT family transport system substrate-binding protein
LTAHIKAVEFIEQNPDESQDLVIKHIKDLTGKEIDKEELKVAFSRLEVTTAVNEQVIQEMADISKEAEYVTSNDIEGMIQLEQLHSLEKK